MATGSPHRIDTWLGSSPDAQILLTADGAVVGWSDGACEIFGYSSDEAIGQNWRSFAIPADYAHDHHEALSQARDEGASTYESVRRRKDGSLLYVDATVRAATLSGESRLVVAEKDVTQIKVRRDGRLMAARFGELLESTPDAIVMANPTGHIVLANAQAERMFGYGPRELVGLPVDRLLPQRLRQAHVAHRSGYFEQPRKRAMGSGLELWGLRKDGSEFPVEISLSPLRTEENAFVMSAIRDSSERRRFERTLQDKNDELARANAAKDRFLAGMSHELRTPLNAIIGFTGTLLMQLPGPLNADQERQLRTVQSSARHLLALINDLLDVARIEAGKVRLHPEDVECASLLAELCETLLPQAQARSLSLHLAAPNSPLHWRTDRRLLTQIVLNLVVNAIKFTREGGVVVELHGRGDRLVIDVHDSGVGIPEQERAKLFTAFGRAADAPLINPDGTGLGLHMSQRLARVLGGEIALTSEVGKGSTFTVSLPPLANAAEG